MTEAELADVLRQARESGDFGRLVDVIPFARFLGIAIETAPSGELIGRLRYSPPLVGNALIPALHGGTIGALLESSAIFELLRQSPPIAREAELPAGADFVPRTINITVEYLRSAKAVDTFARGEITRQGRRVATVRAYAWQDDPARPIAAANAHFLLSPPQGPEIEPLRGPSTSPK